MSFVPLSELQGERVNLQLPEYAPTEAIGINLERIDRLAHLGGFALGETSISTFSGGTTTHGLGVTGRNADGTAIAGAASTRNAERGRGTFEQDSHLGFCHGRPSLTVQVNQEEIVQRLSNASKLRDARAWSAQLDTSIARGLKRASWDHYVGGPHYMEMFIASAGIMARAALEFGGGIDSETPAHVLMTVAIYNMVKGAGAAIADKADPREVCYSLIPGVHPDRALAVGALAKLLPLAKRV
jgi:hypothetical protein